jgi:hypothetical protein
MSSVGDNLDLRSRHGLMFYETEMFFPYAGVRAYWSYSLSLRRCAHQRLHANIGSHHKTIENLDR